MIILYNKNYIKNVNPAMFSVDLGIGKLIDATSCIVKEELNGSYELELEYPITGKYFSNIELDSIIGVPVNPFSKEIQLFRIYEISKPINGLVTINAQHISYDLSYYTLLPKSEEYASLAAAFASLPSDGIPNINCGPFTFHTDKITSTGIKFLNPNSYRSVLAGQSGSFLDTYGGEFLFDNYKVHLNTRRGSNRNFKIIYGKNMSDLEDDISSNNIYTHVYPYYYNTVQENKTGTENYYQQVYIVSGETPLSRTWFSMTDGGQSFYPLIENSPVQVATEGAYKNKVYCFKKYTIVNAYIKTENPMVLTTDAEGQLIIDPASYNIYTVFKIQTTGDKYLKTYLWRSDAYTETKADGEYYEPSPYPNPPLSRSYSYTEDVTHSVVLDTDNGLILVDQQYQPGDRIKILTLDLTSNFSEPPEISDLRAKANTYISENKIGQIKDSITVSFIDIYNNPIYEALSSVYLGDDIDIIWEKAGILSKKRIISVTFNVLTEKYDEIDIGDKSSTLSDTTISMGDNISSLTNDKDYADKTTVNKLIAQSVIAEYIEANSSKLSKAQIDQLISETVAATVMQASEGYIDTIVAKLLTADDAEIKNKLTAGEIEVSGKISALSGYIAGFDIGVKAIKKNIPSFDDESYTGSGVYLGVDGIRLGNKFKVDPDGNVTATTLRTINTVTTYYTTSNQELVPPASGWSENIPSTVPEGYFLWTDTDTLYTDGTHSHTYSKTKYGEKGEQGDPGGEGQPGKIALVYTEMYENETTSSVPSTLLLQTNKFNRTPVANETFTLTMYITETSKTYSCIYTATSELGSYWSCAVNSSVETTGAQGAQGDQGDPGKDTLSYTRIYGTTGSETQPPSTINDLNPSYFNRTPLANEYFNLTVHTSSNSKSFACLYKVTTVGETTVVVTLSSSIDTTGATGAAGKDALVYKEIYNDTVHPTSPGSSEVFMTNKFNRTPITGETFEIIIFLSIPSKTHKCIYLVGSASGSSAYMCNIVSDIEITGPQGSQGDQGDPGKDTLVYKYIYTNPTATLPTTIIAIESQFNRTPVIGENFNVTISLTNGDVYSCTATVTTQSSLGYTCTINSSVEIAAKDPLVYIGSITTTNPTPPSSAGFTVSNFNRTPEINEKFTVNVSISGSSTATQNGRVYTCIYQVASLTVMANLVSSTEISANVNWDNIKSTLIKGQTVAKGIYTVDDNVYVTADAIKATWVNAGLLEAEEGKIGLFNISGAYLTYGTEDAAGSIIIKGERYLCWRSTNYNVNNTVSVMKIKAKQALTLSVGIRSYAEGNYDYVVLSKNEKAACSDTGTDVLDYTKGRQTANKTVADFRFTTISLATDEYVYVVYRKDNSTHSGDDRGYFIIPSEVCASLEFISDISSSDLQVSYMQTNIYPFEHPSDPNTVYTHTADDAKMKIGDKFSVDGNGVITATDAILSGIITASAGRFGNLTIYDNGTSGIEVGYKSEGSYTFYISDYAQPYTGYQTRPALYAKTAIITDLRTDSYVGDGIAWWGNLGTYGLSAKRWYSGAPDLGYWRSLIKWENLEKIPIVRNFSGSDIEDVTSLWSDGTCPKIWIGGQNLSSSTTSFTTSHHGMSRVYGAVACAGGAGGSTWYRNIYCTVSGTTVTVATGASGVSVFVRVIVIGY